MKPATAVPAVLLSLTLLACAQSASNAAPPPPVPAGHTSAAARPAAPAPDADWLTFDVNPQRSGVSPSRTGITAGNARSLTRRDVSLPGTVDSAPVQAHAVRVAGRVRDAVVATTSYGITLAIDPATGARLWTVTPGATAHVQGSPQIMNTAPVISPDHRFVYAGSPDGLIHKLFLNSGVQVRSGGWPVRVTYDPTREKLASDLTLVGRTLYVATDGYIGDAPTYQGHIAAIDVARGRVTHVFNTLCSNIRTLLDPPSRCGESDSAIWGRSGVVVEPGGRRVLVATGNGDFNGRTDWGDSVLELSPSLHLQRNWTPTDQQQLSGQDTDVGSTCPALLPVFGGRLLALQGGKAGIFALLDLDRLNGTRGGASSRTGGELQDIPEPQGRTLHTEPVVRAERSRVLIIAANDSGTTAYALTDPRRPRLHVLWQDTTPGSSPVIAGGLAYIYDPNGTLNIRNPDSGRVLAALPAGAGHWNSPIVAGGRVILPVGNANEHSTSGTLEIFHLPGR